MDTKTSFPTSRRKAHDASGGERTVAQAISHCGGCHACAGQWGVPFFVQACFYSRRVVAVGELLGVGESKF